MTYVVIENTPGYLPENDDPPIVETLEEGIECMNEEVSRYIDFLEESETPFTESRDERSVYITRTDSPHDLGRWFEVVESEEEVVR